MNVLLLSPYPERLSPVIKEAGDHCRVRTEPIDARCVAEADWIVSYGYRHIIKADTIAARPERIVNLHISYLPWNRGTHPNLWSWVDDTPKGVTLHVVDAGIDTGPILAQELVEFDAAETLASSYAKLQAAAEALFSDAWPRLRTGHLSARVQPPGGSRHSLRESKPIIDMLPNGWDTRVADVAPIGRIARRSA